MKTRIFSIILALTLLILPLNSICEGEPKAGSSDITQTPSISESPVITEEVSPTPKITPPVEVSPAPNETPAQTPTQTAPPTGTSSMVDGMPYQTERYNIITSRIYTLYRTLGEGNYFNCDRSTGCGTKSSDHSCKNCRLSSIIKTDWFKESFGNVKLSSLNGHYYDDGRLASTDGWSCYGFANFAQWYIFNQSNQKVKITKVGTFQNTYAQVSANIQVGDVIRCSGHSSVVAAVEKGGIRVLDCNYRGSHNCQIHMHTIPYNSRNIVVTRCTDIPKDWAIPPLMPKDIEKCSTLFSINEPIRFTWSVSSNATSYLVIVANENSKIHYENIGNKTSFSMQPLPKGNYRIFIYAANPYGYSDGAVLDFTVYDSAPNEVAAIKNAASAYKYNSPITITWEANPLAVFYQVYVLNDSHSLVLTEKALSNTFTFYKPEAGNYTVVVRACNNFGFGPGTAFNIEIYKEQPPSPKVFITDATVGANGGIKVEWEQSFGATGYILNIANQDQMLLSEAVYEQSYTFTELKSDTYGITIIAFNDYGNSYTTTSISIYTRDINSDGTLNSADIILLLKQLSVTDFVCKECDINGDDTINCADMVSLLKGMAE